MAEKAPKVPEADPATQIGSVRTPQPRARGDLGRITGGHGRIEGAGRRKGSRSITHSLARQLSQVDEHGWSRADQIVGVLLDVALGRLPPGVTAEASVRVKDRLDAIRILWERAEGKPVARSMSINLAGSPLPNNWDSLPDDERARFLDDLERARGTQVIDVGSEP